MTIRIDGTNTAAAPGVTGADTDTGLQFGTDEIKIVTGGAERLNVDSSGNLIHKFPGRFKMQEGNNLAWSFHNNGYGGSLLFTDESDGTEQVRFQGGTGGISFNGDTAAANALDDYEEGTFTPSYGTGVTSPGYDIQQGHYTKVGNLVSFSIGIRANSGTPNGSHLVITGLPFTTLNSANSEGSAMLVYNGNIIGGNVTPTFYMPINTVNIQVYTSDGNTWAGNTANDVQNRVLRLRGQYQTN